MKHFTCIATLAVAPLFAADVDINPLTTRWTFGAHEPYTMYRRVGNHCTGGIDGNAQWVKPWLDWFDSNAPAVMEELGLNFLHSRFYPGSSVHGILQARILEWLAIRFFRGSSQLRNQTQVSHNAGRFLTS